MKPIEGFVDKGDISCIEVTPFSVRFPNLYRGSTHHWNQDSDAAFIELTPPTNLISWLGCSVSVTEASHVESDLRLVKGSYPCSRGTTAVKDAPFVVKLPTPHNSTV